MKNSEKQRIRAIKTNTEALLREEKRLNRAPMPKPELKRSFEITEIGIAKRESGKYKSR